MKVVILAGGYGTRLSEETAVRPKPMVEIGGHPILWHIMKIYSAHGHTDFVICCGYKGHMIKDYFAQYVLRTSDCTIDLVKDKVEIHRRSREPWRVTLVDTGDGTMTGGRLGRVRDYLDDETFFFTYGDGVADIDLDALLAFHRSSGALATLTTVQPPGRFGALSLGERQVFVDGFREKPDGGRGWINGGFFVLEPGVIDYIGGDDTVWERGPLEGLAEDGELAAYRHEGFWHPMDTLHDKKVLEGRWEASDAPWRVW